MVMPVPPIPRWLAVVVGGELVVRLYRWWRWQRRRGRKGEDEDPPADDNDRPADSDHADK